MISLAVVLFAFVFLFSVVGIFSFVETVKCFSQGYWDLGIVALLLSCGCFGLAGILAFAGLGTVL